MALEKTQLEILDGSNPEKLKVAAKSFKKQGHVALSGLYEAELANAALAEIYARPLRSYGVTPGHETTKLWPPSQTPDSAYNAIFTAINKGASGFFSFQGESGWKPYIQLIRQEPGIAGRRHTDSRSLDRVTAVTNLKDRSALELDLGPDKVGIYELEPGIVVYMRGQEIPHQGKALESTRVGLAVTREVVPLPRAA